MEELVSIYKVVVANSCHPSELRDVFRNGDHNERFFALLGKLFNSGEFFILKVVSLESDMVRWGLAPKHEEVDA